MSEESPSEKEAVSIGFDGKRTVTHNNGKPVADLTGTQENDMAGNSMAGTPARVGKAATKTLKTASPQGVLGSVGAAGAARPAAPTSKAKKSKKK